MEVVFPISKLFKIDLSWFKLSSSVVVLYWGCLLLRSSSTEVSSTEKSSMMVVFPISKFFKIDLDSTRVDLPMLQSKFCWFQANKVVFHRGLLLLRSSSTEFVFRWARFPRRSSSTEVVFYCGYLPFEMVFHQGRLPLMSSSMEFVFPISKFFKIDLDSTRVDLPMLEIKFCSFPAISLLARVGGGGGNWN